MASFLARWGHRGNSGPRRNVENPRHFTALFGANTKKDTKG